MAEGWAGGGVAPRSPPGAFSGSQDDQACAPPPPAWGFLWQKKTPEAKYRALGGWGAGGAGRAVAIQVTMADQGCLTPQPPSTEHRDPPHLLEPPALGLEPRGPWEASSAGGCAGPAPSAHAPLLLISVAGPEGGGLECRQLPGEATAGAGTPGWAGGQGLSMADSPICSRPGDLAASRPRAPPPRPELPARVRLYRSFWTQELVQPSRPSLPLAMEEKLSETPGGRAGGRWLGRRAAAGTSRLDQ